MLIKITIKKEKLEIKKINAAINWYLLTSLKLKNKNIKVKIQNNKNIKFIIFKILFDLIKITIKLKAKNKKNVINIILFF